jgi:hypothetical protein
MGLVKVKPNDPYIRRFLVKIDEYKFICVGFGIDEFKNRDKLMTFSYSVLCRTTPTCFNVVLWRENEVAQYDDWARRSLGTMISSLKQGSDVDLVGTSQKVVVCETRETTRTTCCQVLPL